MINTISNPNTSSAVNQTPVGSPPSDPTANDQKPTEQVQKKFSKDKKKKLPSKYILAGILLLILTIGGIVSMLLIKRSQDLRQQADTGVYTTGSCSSASAAQCQGKDPGDTCGGDGECRALPNQIGNDGKAKCTCDSGINPTTPPNPTNPPQCKEECPGSDGILRNCTPPEGDGTPAESICDTAGRVESCGGAEYCCPSVGGTWTTDMTACSSCTQETGSCIGTDGESCVEYTDGCEKAELCQSPVEECSPTGEPTTEPTTEPTDEPIDEPTAEPTNDSGDDSGDNGSSSSSSSNATVNINTGTGTQPDLPSELPETGPEDWLKYLQVGLGALGAGALLLLFL
jgi:hypothetical protein